MSSIVIRLPGIPPGANELHRMNRYDVGEVRRQWKNDAYLAAKDAVNRMDWVAPKHKAAVGVMFRFGDRRRRDPDNYTAGLKGVLDGLVQAGVLLDDAFGDVSLIVDAQFAVKSGPELIITVSPLLDEGA